MTLPLELRLYIYDICLDDWNDSGPTRESHLKRTDYTYGQSLSKFRWSKNAATPADMPILRTHFGQEAGSYYLRCKLLVEEHLIDTLADWMASTSEGQAGLVRVQATARVSLLTLGHQWVSLHGPAYIVEITPDGQTLELRTKFCLRDDDAEFCREAATNVIKAAEAAGKKKLDGCDVVEVIKQLVVARRHKKDQSPNPWHATLTLAELELDGKNQHKSAEEAAMLFIKEIEKSSGYMHKVGCFSMMETAENVT
jgi:hypothetical protein